MGMLPPWLSSPKDRLTLKEGDRIEVRWGNGNTSAHDFVKQGSDLGFWLNHHETKIWVDLKLPVEFRKIPGGKKRVSDPKPRPRNPNRGM